ncbi:MAG: enoyl-CoA hydratase/isomerase family protein [Candidatus Marinimicrobia bacterium]|nr:enoyl-CoA hydratase/isomerase family protein [Candidatus Neomarinimicrobiota bacterium]
MISYQVDDRNIGVLTLDHPHKPLNILSAASFEELERLLTGLALGGPTGSPGQDRPPVGLIIISGKADNFIVGADIKVFAGFRTAADGVQASRQGQRIFGLFAALPFPTVAAINGTCLGGGLELALNCTSRLISDHPKTALGFPEVKLGLLPGASGCTLLPRLVGLQAALDMMLTGKNVYPYKALKIGLADEIVSAPALLGAAKERVLQLSAGRVVIAKRRKPLVARLLDGPLKPVVYRVARKQVLKQTGGRYPAPLEILKVVRRSLGRRLPAALELEAEGFGRLSATAQHKALTHVFFAGSGKGKLPAEPVAVSRLGVLGAGLMGTGIATVALDKGITVRHKDIDYQALGRARGHIQKYFQGRVKKRILASRETGLTLTHYSPTTDYSGFGRVEVVIEAAFEDLELKRHLIAELEAVVAPETVIATNTSSLPIAQVAAGAQHPERIIGMHFFSPVEKMPLVEVITSKATNALTLATTVKLGRRLGKTVIVAQDSPGFYINRILTPYLNETFKLLEDGIPVDLLDRHVRRMGLPVGPCTLLDEVGLDVAGRVAGVMAPFIGRRLEMTDHNQRFTEDGRLGRKNGHGFYTYSQGKKGPVDAAVYQLLDHPQRRTIPYEQVRDRLLGALYNEAAYCLDEGLIDSASAGDVGAIYGFGFPPFLGGPYWAMDQLGLPALVEQLSRLAQEHGSRFTPAPPLVKRAAAGEWYHPVN